MALEKFEYAEERTQELSDLSDSDYEKDLRELELFTQEVSEIAKWGKVANMHITNLRLRIDEQLDESKKVKASSQGKKRKKNLAESRKHNNGLKVLAGGLKIVRRLCEGQCQWVKRVQEKSTLRSPKHVFLKEVKLRKLLDIMSKEQMACVELLEQRLHLLQGMQAVDDPKPE